MIFSRIEGEAFLCWFHKRSEDNSLLTMWFSEKFLPETKILLDIAQLSYLEKNGNLRLTTSGKTIQKHADLHRSRLEISSLTFPPIADEW